MAEKISLSDIVKYAEISLGELMKAVHRGELRVESGEPGRTVDLEEAIRFCEERGLETDALKRLRKKRVLVVEDDKDFMEMLLDALAAEPRLWVRTAETLFEARELVEEFRPHLIFIDANLPDGYGPDFVRELGRNGTEAELVGMTALSSRRTFEDMEAAGVKEIYLKPLSPDKVLDIVARLFR